MARQKVEADLVVTGIRQCLTMVGPGSAGDGPAAGPHQEDVGLLRDAALAARGPELVYVGPASRLPAEVRVRPGATRIDAEGGVVLPGFVDAHTHLVFGGWRAGEFAQRIAGASYGDILAAGGGILSTVDATRAASEDDLVEAGRRRLRRALELGSTTVEIKSGYGLSVADEAKMLRAVHRLEGQGPWDVVATLLGAHAVPREYREDRGKFVEVVEEMIETLADRAAFFDVFCEEGAFSVDESRRLLRAARGAGLGLKLHADQLSAGGGAELAAEMGATSADHLDRVSPDGMEALAQAGVVGVLLPSVPLYIGTTRQAPAAALQEAGVPLALATDFNPGTSPLQSMGTIVALGCLLLRMSPEAALVAATRNAAWAVGLGDRVGVLREGFQADLQWYRVDDYRMLPYRFGELGPAAVVKKGEVVVGAG